ncbi:hypothetical protein E2C01_058050 [Portunus trituberculatus]|uniref:Uncharacterized protein n=1 Tax=Portunus trituberculatus TaxID=210409 RepID=A0A5B7GYL6_PORTR|nr:hypothetical protein [Portunus trituberculatus]
MFSEDRNHTVYIITQDMTTYPLFLLHTAPTQPKKKGYHWDDYDMRGSRTLVGCGDGATAAPPDLLMLAEGTSLVPTDDVIEGEPLLPQEGVDDSMSELQDSDYESVDRTSNQQTATLVQTSPSEVFL